MADRKNGMENGNADTGAGTLNRTGARISPESALDIIREAQRTPPGSKGDAKSLAEYRAPYLKEKVITGSRPQPQGTAATSARASLVLDKLGERLAFERQGVRLYEGLIGKVKLLGKEPGGPALEDLEHILSEEREHFRFLQSAIIQAGGDPTALTPCANVAGTLSQGIVQVVSDPRTTVAQCLEAVLAAELADNDGWDLLQRLLQDSGGSEMDDLIEEARSREAEHLGMVRGWLSSLVLGRAIPAVKPPARKAPARAKPAPGDKSKGGKGGRVVKAASRGPVRKAGGR